MIVQQLKLPIEGYFHPFCLHLHPLHIKNSSPKVGETENCKIKKYHITIHKF